MPLVRILAGRTAIDGTGENILGAQSLGRINEGLTTFIFAHPNIRSVIDPVYVSIDITTCPNNVAPNVNAYPTAGCPHDVLAPFPGTNNVYRFNGPTALDNAQHLLGWLQGTYPGLRAIIYNTGVPATRY